MENNQFSMLEAFMALDDLTEDTRREFRRTRKLKEGNTYSLHDNKQMEDAHDFREADKKDVTLEVIDTDADTLEHLKDPSDYIGEVILQCNVCKATKFVKLDALIKDNTNAEEQVDIYNVEEECPHCHSKGKGYILIGQVGKATAETTQEAEENKEQQDAAEEESEKSTEETSNEESENNESEESASFSNDESSSDEPKLDNSESKEEEPEEFDWDEEKPEEEEESKNESLEEDEEETPWDETDSHEDEDEGKRTIKASKLLDDKEDLKAALKAKIKNKHKVQESLFTKVYKESLHEARVGKISLDRIKRRETPIEEDFGKSSITIGDFLNTIVGNVSTVNICSDKTKRVINTLPADEVVDSFELSNTPFYKWSTEDDYIDIAVSRNGAFYIEDVFEKFVDNNNTFIVDALRENDYLFADDSHEVEGDFEDVLNHYGDLKLDGGLNLRSINFYVNQPSDDYEAYDSIEEDFIHQLVRLNNLRESKIHTPNTVENFILESIYEREDLDKVYEQYVKPLNDKSMERIFKEEFGYKDDVDLFLESKGISPNKFNEFLENQNKVEDKKECETCPDCKKPLEECTCEKEEVNEEFWKSARDRKQLSSLVSVLQESKMKYVVKRSTNEHYRYDIYLKKNLNESVEDDYQERKADADSSIENKGTIKLTEEPNDLVYANTELAPIDRPEQVDGEVVDGRRHRQRTSVTTQGTTDFDVQVLDKIERIADDIHDSIKNNYDVDVPEGLIVADMIRDLQLVGGAINPEELENTPNDQVRAELYREFTEEFDTIDVILSILSGEEVHTDRAERLMFAVQSLDGDNFQPQYIEQGISSPQFLGMACNGMVPYIEPAEITRKNMDKVQALPDYRRRNPRISHYNPAEDERLTGLPGGQRQAIGNRRVDALPHRRDENLDTDRFESNVNEYFRNTYEENLIYTNDSAEKIEEGYIINGTLEGEDKSLPIIWNLKKCEEGYQLTNNLSEEVLTLTEDCIK